MLIFLSGVLFFLLFIEFFVRIFPSSVLLLPYPFNIFISYNTNFLKKYYSDRGALVRDEDLGYVLKPNFMLNMKSPEYDEIYFFNELEIDGVKTKIGLNDEKDFENVFAIAVGDSFTFCTGVKRDDCWVELLQKRLRKNIVNLGVFGYGTVQKFKMLQKFGIRLRPKIIFWQYDPFDVVDDFLYESSEPLPFIPHPLNIFKESKNILYDFFVTSVFLSIKDFVISSKSSSELFKKASIDMKELQIRYINDSFKEAQKVGAEFYLILISSIHYIEELCTEKLRCIVPKPPDEYRFKNDRHFNKRGNLYLADFIYERLVRDQVVKDN